MPLIRANITRASRIMLPVYVIFFAWVGINYVITPKHRLLESPALRYLDDVLDLRSVGLVLCAASVMMLVALLSRSRDLSRYALLLGLLCFVGLFVAFVAAAVVGEASPSAGAWPFLGTAACLASYRSVTAREVN